MEEEVSRIKSRKNLLLWYTADEPDGWGDPLDAASLAYNKIYDVDGYHPVSLVLNCQDYEFEAYTTGTDIVMQDAYVIGINATHSVVWDTECTPDYGDCGCDNCVGEFEDVSRRVDQFHDRLRALGWERKKAVWTVSQAFGGSLYWSRIPTGREWAVQSLLAVNHGALGLLYPVHRLRTSRLTIFIRNRPLERSNLERYQSCSNRSRSTAYSILVELCFGSRCDVRDLCLATRSFRNVDGWPPNARCSRQLKPLGALDSAR